MKNSFFFLLLFATFFVGCKNTSEDLVPQMVNTETDQIQARGIFCPRTDIPISDVPDMDNLAAELGDVMNCGRAILHPECREGDIFTDEATVQVGEWCFFSSVGCNCTDLPNNFTIADQDAIIAQATTALAAELSICGLDNASFSFFKTDTFVSPACEYVIVRLFATASAECCSNVL